MARLVELVAAPASTSMTAKTARTTVVNTTANPQQGRWRTAKFFLTRVIRIVIKASTFL